jgi:hypothetical protein
MAISARPLMLMPPIPTKKIREPARKDCQSVMFALPSFPAYCITSREKCMIRLQIV